MIQRYLFTILDQALTNVKGKDGPEILTDIFQKTLGLEPEEVASIIKYFAATDIALKQSFARQDDAFPMLSITLANESGETMFLANEGATEDDPEEPDFAEDVTSNVWNHTFQIYCYAQHPDVAEYLYQIAKQAISLNLNSFLADKGLWNVTLNGMDLAPDQRYTPEILFLRALAFRCNDEFRLVHVGSRAGKAFKVTGIAVDKSGSSSDVGGVKTLVKVKP